ncbi:nuclease-related domain-containing protein [Oceanobacillus massiliensis]|uniref:nuclease-related domain-containing protein n=1 Tax=Oceanobacillus massiliensis TaxID=1465765 RepID=UPI000289C0DA|nr:nuclease-related domain-containing protein [Oceanobacillus massiliensis]
MYIKQHDKLNEVFALEALNRRIPDYHPIKEKVFSDWKIKRSEIAGEKELDYPLRFLDDSKFLILHNIRLQDESGFFQIDTLILSKKYILILEAKNWQGTVIFDENGQVIRKRNNQEEEGFPSPIPQVKVQMFRLQKWLRQLQFPDMKIEAFVVISFSSTIIKPANPTVKIPEQVILNNQLYFKIKELEKKYRKMTASMETLKEISLALVNHHTPTNDNLLQKYKLNKSDLVKGVFCPVCNAIPMIRRQNKWHCTDCGAFSSNAHIRALEDYRRIIGNTITNLSGREFLLIESPDVTRRLLLKEKLIKFGKTKGSTYQWKE